MFYLCHYNWMPRIRSIGWPKKYWLANVQWHDHSSIYTIKELFLPVYISSVNMLTILKQELLPEALAAIKEQRRGAFSIVVRNYILYIFFLLQMTDGRKGFYEGLWNDNLIHYLMLVFSFAESFFFPQNFLLLWFDNGRGLYKWFFLENGPDFILHVTWGVNE